ncbi:MAG: Rne/Rng family ribonuclease [Gammaproteobacteria bacterium]|nr:Rne/Rng family ribonuclease [Gammaproteobacteria bacterium]
MKKILINAEQPNEIRIAYVEGGKLTDFEVESTVGESSKGNIYIGVVVAVKTDLEGAFVDIGEERQGLLAFDRAGGRSSRDQRTKDGEDSSESVTPDLTPGQKILVQVIRDARGDKGSALSMELSLPGRFVVLKPNSSTQAVTRNVSDVNRTRLRELGNKLPVVENVGWIMRTTAVNHSLDEITGDFHRLMNLWRKIQKAFEEHQGSGPELMFSDNALIHRVLRDRLRRDGTTVIVDNPSMYREARSYASDFMPELRDQIEQFRGDRPIFNAFRADREIARIYSRKVSLPSGGELVFDPTEALLSIDVNSARNTGRDNLEETALHTNLEAAREIAHQMMIRNIGGLVVVDFIDMLTEGNNERVEQVMRQSLSRDLANSACSTISEFGLMQLNRQRRRPSIYDTHFEECENCNGARFIKKTDTNANHILRELSYLLHDPARQENQYLCRVPNDVAAYVLNKERQFLRDLEVNTHKQVVILADSTLSNDTYDIKARRVKALDYEGGSNLQEVLASEQREIENNSRAEIPSEPTQRAKPLVTPLDAAKPKKKKSQTKASSSEANKKKQTKSKKKQSGFSRFFSTLFGSGSTKQKPRKASAKSKQRSATTGTKGKAAGDQKSRQRNPRAQTTNRRGSNARTGTDNKRDIRRDEQRRNTQVGEPRRTTRRTDSASRERGTERRARQGDTTPRPIRKGSENVRRATDLKKSAEKSDAEERKSSDTAQPNRRAPRRSVAPSPTRAEEPTQQTADTERESTNRSNRTPAPAGSQRREPNPRRAAIRQRADSERPNAEETPQADLSQQASHEQAVASTETVESARAETQANKASSPQPIQESPEAVREPAPKAAKQDADVNVEAATEEIATATAQASEQPRQYASNDPRSPAYKRESAPRQAASQASGESESTDAQNEQPSNPGNRETSEVPAAQAIVDEVQETTDQAVEVQTKPEALSEESSSSRAGNDPRSRNKLGS